MNEKEKLQDLGLIIKLERVKRKLSQEKLAELANLNPRSISLLESGLSDPKYTTLRKIAEAFGMQININ